MGFVDFSRSADQHRLFIVNVVTGDIVYSHYTTHGKGSGGPAKAVRFSNVPMSLCSSKGLYRCAEPYYGKYGYSLRLDGLEKGVNDNARRRAIVMHGSDYVTTAYVNKYGYPGRSWGCITFPKAVRQAVVDKLKNGSYLYVHA